jgi:hypothetical protein
LFSFIKNLFILKIRFVHIRTKKKKKKRPIKFERERERETERERPDELHCGQGRRRLGLEESVSS